MKLEDKAREKIDELLEAAGWEIQDLEELNLGSSPGVAIREFPLKSGPTDYLLFVDREAVGVIEAKPFGTTLSGVAEQSQKYITGVPENLPHVQEPLPFAYESTGIETNFRDTRDPEPCSRRVFAFHKPETLKEWLSEEDTLRARLKKLPPLITEKLRDCQIEAIENLEKSFADAKPRALIQMASGAGKTLTAINSVYRLIKFGDAKRILFLVDRRTLGKQAFQKFYEFETPDDRRKFTELYNIQHLTTNTLDNVSRVCISTIQRLYSMLKGEPEFDPELEERSILGLAPEEVEEREVAYNAGIPIETFDFIVTDECHRSIYNLWRQVLEYFDSFIIGLTATPSKQTLGFFNQNLVTEYPHERAVADGVNVGFEVYRIRTGISEKGSTIDAGYYVDKRDKLTRRIRWEQLDEDLEYTSDQLDRSIVSLDQIRTVIKTFKENLFTEIFPGRTIVPKTLIFAKTDSHAEDITNIIREEFGKGNDFCKKITYKTSEKTEDLIKSFQNSYNPRIAVTVDMISTGTDVKPLECLIFMRDVKSRIYFEQMKGRGTRTIPSADLRSVTTDAMHKTHFIIVDAVGVCENDKTDSKPLERKKSISFEKLLQGIALGMMKNEDSISSLAGRLAALDREIDDKDRKNIKKLAEGKDLKEITNELLDSIEPDKIVETAKKDFNTDSPDENQLNKTAEKLINSASKIFDNSDLRTVLIEIKKRSEQILDTVSKDSVISAGFDVDAKEKAKTLVDTFKKFIEDNKDELTALQIIYNQPYGKRHITFEQIKEVAEAIEKPPYRLTTDLLWQAYERLEKSKVHGAGPKRLLTDIVSLVRFAIGESVFLESFSETVNKNFEKWLEDQEELGKRFNEEQLKWLELIKKHISSSLEISRESFEYTPFQEKGGLVKISQVFGDKLDDVLDELNEVLVA